MIGIFCEMTKCGFTFINGDFAFARNAKWALVDDCLLEGIIWLRKYAAPTGILIGLKFGSSVKCIDRKKIFIL